MGKEMPFNVIRFHKQIKTNLHNHSPPTVQMVDFDLYWNVSNYARQKELRENEKVNVLVHKEDKQFLIKLRGLSRENNKLKVLVKELQALKAFDPKKEQIEILRMEGMEWIPLTNLDDTFNSHASIVIIIKEINVIE